MMMITKEKEIKRRKKEMKERKKTNRVSCK